ncbi:MAG: UvrD-helicase domain-containing protein [Candidatus Pacebacteria bacterium]|nr:UvrD-helicase domain-containing protein [Candidatus Paceibacterota bacterium]
MSTNKLIIAAAGSGKTTHLVKEALAIKKDSVLITTFTEVNEKEIRKKIIEIKKYIPKNITIQTWFSFLLQHGVRPYQGIMHDKLFVKKIGFYLVEGKSGLRGKNSRGIPIYWGESDFKQFYFTKNYKIYSDKISKFVFECNKKSNNEIINRLSKIYHHIFIDEIQDLAGWDLELLKLLFNSESHIQMVGDPRQATYSTNDSAKYKQYKNGKIQGFIDKKCKKDICKIDITSLSKSHRNNQKICSFSSNLYTEHPNCESCECKKCRENISEHEGIFLIKSDDIENYCKKYETVTKLHYQKAKSPDLNYGASKGLSFDRVLIYPTDKIKKYIKDGNLTGIETVKAKFYVAVTRARYSVGIIYDYNDNDTYIEGVEKYILEGE